MTNYSTQAKDTWLIVSGLPNGFYYQMEYQEGMAISCEMDGAVLSLDITLSSTTSPTPPLITGNSR